MSNEDANELTYTTEKKINYQNYMKIYIFFNPLHNKNKKVPAFSAPGHDSFWAEPKIIMSFIEHCLWLKSLPKNNNANLLMPQSGNKLQLAHWAESPETEW